MAVAIPLTALFTFCALALVVQGVVLVSTDSVQLPCLTTTREAGCESLSGGFFSDVVAVAGFFVDGVVFFFQFITFDLVPAIPWFFQVPLALVCGGSILFALVWLISQVVTSIGGLIPFT